MLSTVCQFDAHQHRLIHPTFEPWIKRQVSDVKLRDSLFVYYHSRAGTYVVAHWVRNGQFVDVLNLGHSPLFTPDQAYRFKSIFLRPLTPKQLCAKIVQNERDRTSIQNQENDQQVAKNNRMSSTAISISMQGASNGCKPARYFN